MPINVTHLSFSDIQGGAARAAYRIHHAQRRYGIQSQMDVALPFSDDPTVDSPNRPLLKRARQRLRPLVGRLPLRLLQTGNPVHHSPALLPSGWPRRINRSAADIVNLHWIGDEMLSVGDLARMRKPLVWTMHDMWGFCGAEHYTTDERYRTGYTAHNRPDHESGPDINRWIWQRKRRAWQQPIQIVTPSRWLADCVKNSALMQEWPVTIIPYPIDLAVWQPIEKRIARQLLDLPQDTPLLCFGAVHGGRDPRKGFDLLLEALAALRTDMPELALLVFGQSKPDGAPDYPFPVHFTGHLHDNLSLKIVYNAADAMLLPSRQDNLPNTGLEALACGTPVIAFDTGGLPDIVTHRETGWLARPFDPADLAHGIHWVLSDPARLAAMGTAAREFAVQRFAPVTVARQYLDLYNNLIPADSSGF